MMPCRDNIATDISMGMDTTAGSYALRMSPHLWLDTDSVTEGCIVPREAMAVQRLRQAGAISLWIPLIGFERT